MSGDVDRFIIDPVTKELVDPTTGEVLNDHPVDLGREWRQYSYEEYLRRARASSSITPRVHDYGLSTVIGSYVPIRDIVARQRAGARSLKDKLYLLNHVCRVERADKELLKALEMLNRSIARLDLPEETKRRIAEEASIILRRMRKEKLFGKKKVAVAVAAAIALAMEQLDMPVVKRRIADEMCITYRDLLRMIRKAKSAGIVRCKIIDPRIYLSMIAERLGVSPKVVNVAARIVDALKRKNRMIGKIPQNVAAAAIYIASIVTGARRTQEEVAQVVGAKASSIRLSYKDIIEHVEIVVRL